MKKYPKKVVKLSTPSSLIKDAKQKQQKTMASLLPKKLKTNSKLKGGKFSGRYE